MKTHADDAENIFCCKSTFRPKVVISLQDNVPELVKQERKKAGGIEYLPGERLLIQLGKKAKVKETPDINRITKSLQRVLLNF